MCAFVGLKQDNGFVLRRRCSVDRALFILICRVERSGSLNHIVIGIPGFFNHAMCVLINEMRKGIGRIDAALRGRGT